MDIWDYAAIALVFAAVWYWLYLLAEVTGLVDDLGYEIYRRWFRRWLSRKE